MQSIIMYRNPLEAAFWESMMNGGAIVFIIVIGIALVGVATYAMIESAYHRARHNWRNNGTSYRLIASLYAHNGKISLTVSFFLALTLHLWYIS